MITIRNTSEKEYIKENTGHLSPLKNVVETSNIQPTGYVKPLKITISDEDEDGYLTSEELEKIDGTKLNDIANLDLDSKEYKDYYNFLYSVSENDEELKESLDEMESFLKQGFADSEESIQTFSEYNLAMYKMVRSITTNYPIANRKAIKTYDDEQLEFFKCKYDIVYWLENYCIIQGAGAFVRIQLNDSLRTVARLFEASVLTTFVTSRQSSKTTIALACISWYFNFWANVNMQLINLSVSDNNKNMQMIKLICQSMPLFLRTWVPERKGSMDIDNIASKQSTLNSRLKGLTIDKQDPDSTGRGSTSALYYDEVAYLKSIDIAYASITFALIIRVTL